VEKGLNFASFGCPAWIPFIRVIGGSCVQYNLKLSNTYACLLARGKQYRNYSFRFLCIPLARSINQATVEFKMGLLIN
jgi:hypothetical protein